MPNSEVTADAPAIRFAGFEGPWERKRFDAIFRPIEDRGHPELAVLSATQVRGMVFRGDCDRVVTHDIENEVTYKRMAPGDFAIHLRSFQGGIAHSAIEGITSPAYTILRIKDTSSDSDGFWRQLFMSDRFINSLKTVTYGIRDGRSIAVDEFMKSNTLRPSLPEQEAIGSLFSALDALIEAEGDRLAALRTTRESMLARMFPREGEIVPEVRFSGFEGAWERKRLGELYRLNNERNSEGFTFRDTFSVATMSLNPEGNGAEDSSLSNYKVIRVGDAAFEGHTNKEFAFGRFVVNDVRDGIMSPRFSCIRPTGRQVVPFWKYYLHSEKVMRGILVRSTKSGTMMNELVPEDLFKESIPVPSLPEQRAIGSFFSRLDALIEARAMRVETLRRVQSGLLARMFG